MGWARLGGMTQPVTAPHHREAYPLAWIRGQYPALQAEAETDRVFLDNASGSQLPQAVIDAVVHTLSTMNVNKGGAYRASQRVTAAKEQVRALVAAFLNAPGPRNVSFGPNATTLVELLAQSFGKTLQAGDEIIVSGLEHHANRDPWRRLEAQGVVVKTWQVDGEEARLRLEDLDALLTSRTRLVALTAASNALGTVPDVVAAAERVHAVGARLMVDAVHYAPHALPDVQAWDVDMLVFSPYKVFGPHLGVLYLKSELLEALPAPKLAFLDDAEPVSWEPGTQNHEAIVGFGGTFSYLGALAAQLGAAGSGRAAWSHVFQAFAEHETALFKQLLTGLDALGATRYGLSGTEGRTATVSFNLGEHTPQAVAGHLASHGITAASGHYYAYELMMHRLGLAERGGAVRLSILHYNSAEDVDAVLTALAELV